MKNKSRMTLKLLCSAILLSGVLSADVDKCEGVYYLTAGSQKQADSKNESVLKESQEDVQDVVDHEVEEKVTHGVYYYTSHSAALFQPIRVWEYKDQIQLSDGSIWSVALGDRWKLADWLISDVIVIIPNHSFFTFYDYLLVNQRTGDRIEVNLSEIEVLAYDASYRGQRHWIISIDYFSNLVTLEDGSVWGISFDDDSILQRWLIGDILIVGINDDWNSGSHPNVLINFNSLKHAHANCLN